MLPTRCKANRGKINPAVLFVIAAAVVLVAIALFLVTRMRTETKQKEHFGEVGVQSRFKLTRTAGINLPYADQAAAAQVSPDTVVEIPIEWGDATESDKKINERYDAICTKLAKPTGVETYDETITLKVDRDLPYRSLVQAVTLGNDKGFNKFQVACHPRESAEVGCLRIDLPTDIPAGKNVLLFRMVKEGEGIRYVFGISKVREYNTLKDATTVMKNTAEKGVEGKILVLQPALEISVQNVVEALNAATFAGFPKITLARVNLTPATTE
jgi:biopolymer transport protein ExbD